LGTPPEEPTEQMPRYPTGSPGWPGASTGPITDEMPRTNAWATGDPTSGRTATGRAWPPSTGTSAIGTGAAGTGAVENSGPTTAISSPAELFDDEDQEPGATGGREQAGARDQVGGRTSVDGLDKGMPDVPAGLAADDPGVRAGSGLKAWAILIAQGIGGAVGGALLWVGFRYLWLKLPVAALAAAVVATAGLVLMVRAIRGSDDPQTTMLAVLVGLIVTISPAVLLLTLH
jgi:hypothetical protein